MNDEVGAGFLEWIPDDSRLCAVCIRGSFKASRTLADRCLSVISTFAVRQRDQNPKKDRFYRRLHDLLRTAQKYVIFIGRELNARVGSTTIADLAAAAQTLVKSF